MPQFAFFVQPPLGVKAALLHTKIPETDSKTVG